MHSSEWFFSLICPEDRAEDVSVDGWVQSTTLSSSLMNTLEASSSVEQANLYLQEGLWSEAVLLLMNAPQANPNSDNWLTTWNSVLQTLSPAPVSLDFATVFEFGGSSALH